MKTPARGWPDLPVLAEPQPEPTPSAPWRVKLGTAIHLNGRVPRGVPLHDAIPRRCRVCGGLFIVVGKGSNRARYCDECRASTPCPTCKAPAGTHSPSCAWLRPRPCRGCGVEKGHDGGRGLYCETCRAKLCPECGRFAAQHRAACRYDQRQRRQPTTYHGVVTVADVLALYLEAGPTAIRHARKIVGGPEAEDVLHDVMLWLLEHRDVLKRPPGRAYLFKAVTNTALRRHLYAWSKYVVAMDPEDLVLAEQATYPGRATSN